MKKDLQIYHLPILPPNEEGPQHHVYLHLFLPMHIPPSLESLLDTIAQIHNGNLKPETQPEPHPPAHHHHFFG